MHGYNYFCACERMKSGMITTSYFDQGTPIAVSVAGSQ